MTEKPRKGAKPAPTTGERTVSTLTPAPWNPRTISEAQRVALSRAMEVFGDLGGIVYNVTTGNLVGGHQRVSLITPDSPIIITERYSQPNKQGTIAVGYIEVDGERWSFREVVWDEQSERAANVAANKHGGEWDMGKLSDVLSDLDANGYDMQLTGFTEHEMAEILGQVPNFEPASEDEQGKLDEKKPIECPKCGHEFVPG